MNSKHYFKDVIKYKKNQASFLIAWVIFMIICFIILMSNRSSCHMKHPQQLRRKLQVTFTENISLKSLADCVTQQDYFKFSLSFWNLFKK